MQYECHAQSGFRQSRRGLDRLLYAENRRAAHTVQRLKNDVAVFSQNAFSCALLRVTSVSGVNQRTRR